MENRCSPFDFVILYDDSEMIVEYSSFLVHEAQFESILVLQLIGL